MDLELMESFRNRRRSGVTGWSSRYVTGPHPDALIEAVRVALGVPMMAGPVTRHVAHIVASLPSFTSLPSITPLPTDADWRWDDDGLITF